MKKSILFLVFSVIILSSFCNDYTPDSNKTECDIYCFYTSEYAPVGSKGLSDDGEIIELHRILIPCNKLKDGVYRTSITEVADNYYNIDGSDLYFESTICLEPSISEDVLIKVSNIDGLSFGTVIFSDK